MSRRKSEQALAGLHEVVEALKDGDRGGYAKDVEDAISEWQKDLGWIRRLKAVVDRLEKEVLQLWLGLHFRKAPAEMGFSPPPSVLEAVAVEARKRTPPESEDVDALIAEAQAKVAAATPGVWGQSTVMIGPDDTQVGRILFVLDDSGKPVKTLGWMMATEGVTREEDVALWVGSKRLVTMLVDALVREREKNR